MSQNPPSLSQLSSSASPFAIKAIFGNPTNPSMNHHISNCLPDGSLVEGDTLGERIPSLHPILDSITRISRLNLCALGSPVVVRVALDFLGWLLAPDLGVAD